MRLTHLVARGFRNLADLDQPIPYPGVALLGPNGQGKTSFLEAVAYPVLFRSFRGAPDAEVARTGGPGFAVECTLALRAGHSSLAATWRRGRGKTVRCDGETMERITAVAGRWLAVTFLPDDTALASGGAAVRRAYLDRMLGLADGRVLRALSRYRAAVTQRNAALRRRDATTARLYEAPIAEAGAVIVAARLRWIERRLETLQGELLTMGERAMPGLDYAGDAELADRAAWPAMFDAVRARDEARGTTSRGPHRDDLVLTLDEQPVRNFASTGQQRTVAIALRLTELETLTSAHDDDPALILDDVFAELDGERQERLAARLTARLDRQVFVSAPRAEELPASLTLPVWRVQDGRVAP